MKAAMITFAFVISMPFFVLAQESSYLTWTARQASTIGKSMRRSVRVSGTGRGLLNTNKSSSYKVRATWLTPEVIRATARLNQINNRLSNEETMEMVRKAEESGDLIFMIEIDPNEGSGIVPSNWQAFLQPGGFKRGQPGAIKGAINSSLGRMKVLNGIEPRDYDYDVFWAAFALNNETRNTLFNSTSQEIELVVRIEEKEGKIRFPIPDSFRKTLANKN